jgi:hypothetical protein
VVAPAAPAAPQTRKYAALDLARKGLLVHPLCWPDQEGQCACHKKHIGRNVGKAPLTDRGYKDASSAMRTVWDSWDEWPDANIGIARMAPDIPGTRTP